MDNIEIKWSADGHGKKFIKSEGISNSIEISEDSKEIKNAKTFFREIIYQSFLNGWKKQIELVNDPDIEVDEVKPILNELIELCNSEIEAKAKHEE